MVKRKTSSTKMQVVVTFFHNACIKQKYGEDGRPLNVVELYTLNESPNPFE